MVRLKKQIAGKDGGAVKGLLLPAPHLTRGGLWLILRYLAFPLLAALFALDVVLYFVFKYAFDSCYGVLCLM